MLTTLKLFMLGLLFLPSSAPYSDPQIRVHEHSLMKLAQDYGSGLPHVGGIVGAIGVPVIPPDWCGSFDAIWSLDESSGTRSVQSCASCSDCNLTDNFTVTQNTTAFIEGTAAADFAVANTEWLSCTDAVCNELDYTSTLSAGCFVRRATVSAWQNLLTKKTPGTVDGYALMAHSIFGECADPTNALFAIVDDGPSSPCIACSTATSDTTDRLSSTETWYFTGMVYDDSGDTLTIYLRGGVDSVSCTQGAIDNAIAFNLGAQNGTWHHNGELDECWSVGGKALTAAELCRICSCGPSNVDNRCACNSANQTLYFPCLTNADCNTGDGNGICDTTAGTCQGYNHSECEGCTLPTACNASPP
jgi:hypothetical protein